MSRPNLNRRWQDSITTVHDLGTPIRKATPARVLRCLWDTSSDGLQGIAAFLTRGEGVKQLGRVGVVGIVVKRPPVTGFDNLSRIHDGDTVGHLGDNAKVMGN